MAEERFGLKHRPFPTTPDTAYYYPATPHETALAPLVRAIRDKEGLALLTGDPGTGKTLLGQLMLERLGDNVVTAFITNTHLADRAALLQALLFDLGLPYADGTEQVLRLRLTEAVLNHCREGRRTVAVIDEAQHLSPDLLEELRLLGNLEAGSEKAFQVVCLAQTPIAATLKLPEMTPWKQRLAVHVHLGPLSVEESFDYLRHHIRLAGGNPEKIKDEAGVGTRARATHGIPRLLNQAAHHALVLADAAAMDRIDVEVAIEALAAIGLPTDHGGADDLLAVASPAPVETEPKAKKKLRKSA
ncbi:MAG: AAA family ATPase [Gemmataceae bacterium]|nr:AAA family ATPase [Gemmataceae bacterium]